MDCNQNCFVFKHLGERWWASFFCHALLRMGVGRWPRGQYHLYVVRGPPFCRPGLELTLSWGAFQGPHPFLPLSPRRQWSPIQSCLLRLCCPSGQPQRSGLKTSPRLAQSCLWSPLPWPTETCHILCSDRLWEDELVLMQAQLSFLPWPPRQPAPICHVLGALGRSQTPAPPAPLTVNRWLPWNSPAGLVENPLVRPRGDIPTLVLVGRGGWMGGSHSSSFQTNPPLYLSLGSHYGRETQSVFLLPLFGTFSRVACLIPHFAICYC